MTKEPDTADWTALFQGTRGLPDAVRARLRAEARTTTYRAGAVVFSGAPHWAGGGDRAAVFAALDPSAGAP